MCASGWTREETLTMVDIRFDEVHFGKFAGFYLKRTYFFDVHPPLAKLMLAGMGWLIGYDGHFDFGNIGDSYIENNVPYIGLRSLPATLNVLCVVLLYNIMRESGYAVLTCTLTASMYLLGKGKSDRQISDIIIDHHP